MKYLFHSSPLGPMRLAADGEALAGVWFEGQKHFPQDVSGWTLEPSHPLLCEAARQMDAYFDGRLPSFDLPLAAPAGTAFQQRVWDALLNIPRGATESYGELARRLGHASAVRAVGAAVGRNPWSVVVPCHRVLGKAGALTGYAGGIDRKTALLRLEGALRH
jgi:methylated-DNA-[protein]-cysteine S-methyltransferase